MRLALALVVALAGCGGASESVTLSDQWPSRGGDYRDVTEAWTRHAELSAGYQEALVVDATFKSPEWRAAYVDRISGLANLSAAQRSELVAEQQKAAAEHYEFQLLVTTWDRRENDLHRGARSVWKVVLVDEAGTAIEPAVIERDRRPENVLRAEFPAHGDFSQAYVARFPRRVELLRPGAKGFRLRIWGARGAVEMAWRGR